MNKRLHEYSRASRFRIERLLRNARQNITAEASSSDSDEEVRPALHPRCVRDLGDASIGPTRVEDDQLNHDDGSRELSPSDASDTDGNEINILHAEQGAGFEDLNGIKRGNETDASQGEESFDSDRDSVNQSDEMEGADENEEMDFNDPLQPEEDYEWALDHDALLYDMAPITLGESMVSILSFYLRHNLPLTALSDLIDLVGLHCRQEGNRFPPSLHQFKTFFGNVRFPIVRHYYCSVCFKSLPRAGVCDNHQNQSDFFIQVPIISQLKALYKRPGFREKLNYKFNRTKFVAGNYEDIYDGAVYRSLSEPGKILSDPSNISLMWYTDGVSIFKSSKSEIWPFYLVINELRYNDRSKLSNAILAGLWFGKVKPVPSTFLKPIKNELLRLKLGVNIPVGNDPAENITVRGIVICGTADIPAKAKFLNFKAHNSTHGCAKCTMQTINIRRGLNVYPFRENLHLRTEQETIMHAREALHNPAANNVQRDVFGVKGPSILSTFVHQYVRAVSVDEMHCVFLGVMKSLMTLWFEPQHNDRGYSLHNYRMLVNERLSSISPPGFVQRLTRNLDDIKYWKAHEMKTFLFYYCIPVLCDVMPEIYFDHCKLLVFGLYLLNQRSVSERDVNVASDLLTEYVAQFQDLYGIENMTCNLHQFLHLPEVVRDFGPLWVTTCFPFEDLNGKLKKTGERN